jgi:hypothetical protein
MISSWWMVTSRVTGSYTTPQFAVEALSAREALETAAAWIDSLNLLLPAEKQLSLGAASRIEVG